MVEGQKMSKSLGNFYTLRDLLRAGLPPEAIRYLLASVPYRKQLNFTFDGLKSAATAIERLAQFQAAPGDRKIRARGRTRQIAGTYASEAQRQFKAGLDDDLNTAEALAAVFEYRPRMRTSPWIPASSAPAMPLRRSICWSGSIPFLTCCGRRLRQAGTQRRGDRSADRGAHRRQEGEELRARRSNPRPIAGAGHHSRRHQGRRSLETKMKIHTKAVHAGDRKKPGPHIPVTTPIYTASSFFYENDGGARPHLRPRRRTATATRATTIPPPPRSRNWWRRSKAGTARWLARRAWRRSIWRC